MSAFKKDQLVWAKVRGFPWWPAVVTKSNLKKNGTIEKEVTVIFLQENKIGKVPIHKILDYQSNYAQLSISSNKKLGEAIRIANTEFLANQQNNGQKVDGIEENELNLALNGEEEAKIEDQNCIIQEPLQRSHVKSKAVSKKKGNLNSKKDCKSPEKKLSKLQKKQIRKQEERSKGSQENINYLQRRSTRSQAKSDRVEIFSEPLIYSIRKMRKYNPDNNSDTLNSEQLTSSIDGGSKESSNDSWQFNKFRENILKINNQVNHQMEEEEKEKVETETPKKENGNNKHNISPKNYVIENQDYVNKSLKKENKEEEIHEGGSYMNKKKVYRSTSRGKTAMELEVKNKARMEVVNGMSEKENLMKEDWYQNFDQMVAKQFNSKINEIKASDDHESIFLGKIGKSPKNLDPLDFLIGQQKEKIIVQDLKSHSKKSPSYLSSSSQASTSLTLQGSKSIKTTDSILGKLENEIEEIVNYLQLKIKNKEIFEEDNLVYTKLEKITRELEETPKNEIKFLSDNLSDLICNAYALFNENHLLGVRSSDTLSNLLKIVDIISKIPNIKQTKPINNNGKSSSNRCQFENIQDEHILLRKSVCQSVAKLIKNLYSLDAGKSEDLTLILEGRINNYFIGNTPNYQRVMKILYKLIKLKRLEMEELESITKMGSDDFRDWIKTKVECIILTKQITKNFINSNQNFSKPVIMTEDDSLQKLI